MKTLLVALGSGLAIQAGAQQTPLATTAKIPIRHVAPPDATTRERLKIIQALVQFADGRVLVNDIGAQRATSFSIARSRHSLSLLTRHKSARVRTRTLGFRQPGASFSTSATRPR